MQGKNAARTRRAWLGWIAAACVICASACLIPFAGAASQATGRQAGSSPLIDVAAAQTAQRKQAARLKRPAARRVRRRSRSRFANKSARRARSIDRHAFPDALDVPALDAETIDPTAESVSLLSETAAVLKAPDGERTVRVSAVPVAVPKPGTDGSEPDELRSVDLSLKMDGDSAKPEVPWVASSISTTLAGGSSVDGDYGLRLRAPEAPKATVGEGRVWFTNADVDTDVVQWPVLNGVETSLLLRSAASPEHFEFDITAPADAKLRVSSGGQGAAPAGTTSIVEDGEVAARVSAVTVLDADGQPVRVTTELSGRRLLVDVEHRDKDLRYPLHVDPTVDVPYPNGADPWAGWNPWWSPHQAFYGEKTAGPIYIKGAVGAQAWNGDHFQYRIFAPAGTYMSGVNFYNFSHTLNVRSGHGAYLGLADSSASVWGDNVGWVDSAGNNGVQGYGGPWYGAVSSAIWDMCYLAPGTGSAAHQCDRPPAGWDGNSAIIGLVALNPYEPSPWWMGDGGFGMSNASVRLGDRSGPYAATLTGSTASGLWRDDLGSQTAGARAASTFELQADTGGLPLRGASLTAAGGTYTPANPHAICSDPIRQGAPPAGTCTPLTYKYVFSGVQLPEGESSVGASAHDLVYNGTPAPAVTARIDRTPPTGPAPTTTGAVVQPGRTTISGTITDANSGPASWNVEARREGDTGAWTQVCSATFAANVAKSQPASCPWPSTWQSAATGVYQLRARMVDQLASPMDRHTGYSPETRVVVLNSDDSEGSQLGLERWWSFDSADTGGGSTWHTNGWNGNGVWQLPLLDNPGRGLDTSLSLTYNSRE